jgi:hypothetical protein
MKVQVEENLYIESDANGYQVKKYNGTRFDTKANRDIDVTETLANDGSVKGCAKFIALNLKVKESTATTLHELIKDVARIEQYVEDKINF